MPSGGRRNNSGPPPDPNALRRERRDDGEWTVLPAEGRDGEPPAWPLEGQTEREAHLWRELWAKPQAELWERQQQFFEVALHVRCLAEAEQPNAATSLRTLVRQQADALLLTIPAMHSARVRMAEDEVAAARHDKAEQPDPESDDDSIRGRMRAVESGGA